MNKNCANCEFSEWVEVEEDETFEDDEINEDDEIDEIDEEDEGEEESEVEGEEEILECHRFPPQGDVSVFPMVTEDDWCGEWKSSGGKGRK
jgi:hypothetical protein